MSRPWSYAVAAGALLLALVGCGGGGWSGADPVTGITATNFKYGQLATLTISGNALDNPIKLSSDKCTLITLGAVESASVRRATCFPTATGAIQFTVKSNSDYELYSTTLTVPNPVTQINASNLQYGQTAVLTLSGDPQIGSLKVTGDKCTGMKLDDVSAAATRTARCTVNGTGNLKFTVTDTSGTNTFYTQTVFVPGPVMSIGASNLKYSQTAVLNLTGDVQFSTLKVTADKCSNIVLDAVGSGNSRIARCTVNGTGDLNVSLSDSANGANFHNQTFTVPEPQVTMVTSLGTVVMELNPTAAPITVKNFLAYVNQTPSFYKDTLFHRVITNFMAQGGGFVTGMVKKTGLSPAITLESKNGLQNVRGSVAMARIGPATGSPETDITKNSATSQFFVNLVNNTSLNYASDSFPGYAVFGKVITGMDVIDQMTTKTTQTVGINENVPLTDITITSASQTQ